MDHSPSTPRGPAGMVLHRTRSQEELYAQPGTIPVALYPPDMSMHQLGQQVRQVVDAQGARIDSVQQAVGAQTQQTYEQLMVLHQQQQVQAQAQMEMNHRLMAELVEQRDRQQALMDQLAAQRATAEHHEQGLRAAALSSVQQADALEEMRRRTSARWHAFTAAPAPVPAQAAAPGIQLVYGFQEVPKAPVFYGSTKVQKRKFMDQYEAYRREIALANAQRPGGQQIMQMPLSGCIDPLSVERIAYWEIGKPSHELTEEDWRTYFLGARECDPVDMTKLNQSMAKLKIDVSIQSTESRVSKLVSDFEAILVRLSMEGFAESEPKLTVDFLVAAINPPVVQKRVKELLKLNENRALKKSARTFKIWLSEYMRRYGEFEPLVQSTPAPPAKTADRPKSSGKTEKPQPKSKSVAVVNVDKAKSKSVAVVNVDKVPVTNFQSVNGKAACFKCLSQDHGVFKCKKCAPGEAQLLMDRAREVWAEKKAAAVTVAKMVKVVEPSEETAVMCAARVVCTASQAIALDASFDSGVDQSVIPPSTLRMLQDAGREVMVSDLPAPVVVRGFVGPSHTVTQEVKFDLKFDTDAGPLMLTNVKCWLSLGDLPRGVGDILLSRPIMYKLGYDPQTMLREAAAVCSEYDMTDVESASGVIKAVMIATKQELTDDLAEEEEALVPMELAACFPDMTPVDQMAEQAKVQLVLNTRVADAAAAGCGSEFAAGLLQLLTKYVDVFRLNLGQDPPVSMPPLKVHLAKDAKPVKYKALRYSLPQREFMQKHVKELETAGFIYRNPTSRWACAPLIVRKPHTKNEFRMTVDLRPVNSQTEQIAWPMPMLEVVVDHLSGATCFFLLDFFKG